MEYLSFVIKLCPVFIFHKKENFYPSAKENINKINSNAFNKINPIYFHHNKQEQYITFLLIYKFDTGIHNVGAHETDIEFVRVFYDSNNEPIKYYFSQHGRDQGMYLDYNQVQKNMDGNTCVYVAKGTHAHYPKKSIWVRGFCFANDVTDDALQWKPTNLIEIKDPQEIEHQFGSGRMQWHAMPKDIIGAPKKKILNILFRFFLPLSIKLRKRFHKP